MANGFTPVSIRLPPETFCTERLRRIQKLFKTKLFLLILVTPAFLPLCLRAFFSQKPIRQSFDSAPVSTGTNVVVHAMKRDGIFSWRENASTDVFHSDARACYGDPDAWFEVYTLIANLESHHIDAVLRNTLKWTTQHGVRYCVRKVLHDASRTASWNKVAATVEMLMCSRAKWALSLDADAIIQNFELSPQDMLNRIEREIGNPTFESMVLFFSAEFGRKKNVNPINAGVYFMRVDVRTIKFLCRVWNDYHGIDLFHFPYYEEQAAMRKFMIEDANDFAQDAIILPYALFNSYWREERTPDDFLVHYAGFGRGRAGPKKNKDKYDTLSRMVYDTLKDEPPISSSVVTYPGRTRFASTSILRKVLLRSYPTTIVLNSCKPAAVKTSSVILIR